MRHALTCLTGLLLLTLATVSAATAQELEVVDPNNLAAKHLGANLVDSQLVQPVVAGHRYGPPDWVHGYPGWYAAGDALFWHRNRPRDGRISVGDNGTLLDLTDDTPLITGSDLSFQNFETGYRLMLGRSLGNGLALEGQYFQINEWDTSAMAITNGILGPNPLAQAVSIPVAFDAGVFSQAVQQIVHYRSELQGAEGNLRATWQRGLFLRSELVGIRYVKLTETFSLFSQDETTSTPLNGIGTYDTRSDNDLLGLHLGEELGFTMFQRVCVSTQIKAGAFVNATSQTTRIVVNSVQVNRITDNDANLAFVGELNVNATLKLTGMLSMRAGYNFMWLDGLALAPEQDYPNGLVGRVNLSDGGGLFLHGFNIGLELVR